MKNILVKFKEKENIPYLVVLIFSLISIFLYFLPFYVTTFKESRILVNGFDSFKYLEDSGNNLYNSVSMFVVSLVILTILFLYNIYVIISSKEKKLLKFLMVLILIIALIVFEFLGIYFSSKIDMNVKCDIYPLLSPYFSLILLFAYLFIANKNREK